MKTDSKLSRRQFVKGVAISTLLASGTIPLNADSSMTLRQDTIELSGTEFHLSIDETVVNITGEPAIATTVNGMLSGPVLRWREGDEITIHVTNNLKTSSSIHWHGIILPPQMDGVPGISFAGIAPGETFIYQFKVSQSGTYWYHSHSDFQEQTGIYGAIVIDPIEADPYVYDRDYVITLSDWSDEKPERIYRKLKLSSDYYNFQQRTVGDFFSEVAEKGFFNAWSDRSMWNGMRMSDRDISDVSGYTYTFLMNGQNPASQWKALFSAGEKIRLRFINSAAMTFFDVRIPGLRMTVVAADGNNIQPVSVDEFRIGVAETYDVIVEPKADTAYALFAQAIDRSGYAVGSLTYDAAVSADIPKMDPMPILSHNDMGMNMKGMDHSDNSMDMNEDKGKEDHSAMQMDDTPITDHSTMDHSKMKMDNMNSMDHSAMGSMQNEETKPIPITPLPFAEGVQTTMKAMDPQYRLSDPGVGLRNNGRRVLTYADLKNIHSTMHAAEPDREIILHLTGNMERYMWSINGIKYADAAPLEFQYGERLRVTFINDTMMNHPMHLHGMWSDLETGDNHHLPRKHTIIVQPGSKISYRVTVDAEGAWAFHCHLIYHMAGMFRKVVVV